MSATINSEHGEIKIHRIVPFQIVETAVCGINGVKLLGWSAYGWKGKVLKWFGKGGIKVNLRGPVKIVIPITVEHQVNIIDVAHEVQKKVISALKDSLKIDSLTVDVKIKNVVE